MVKLFLFYKVSLLLFILSLNGYAQSFLNGDLEGNINGISSLPNFWQKVSVGDINCFAIGLESDSPDLISLTLPDPSVGLNGNPFSGSTFVGGYLMLASTNPFIFAHEGIMQHVQGLEIEHMYEIHFRQTVVKLIGARDNSGSWAIYIDSLLAGITTITTSDEQYNSNNLPWESRSIYFTATSTNHLIKFLPMDNDTNYIPSTTDTTGALYMGIDSIGLEVITGLNNINKQNEFSLSPNPNTGNFKLQYNGILNKTTMLYITDVYGKIIDAKEIVNATTTYENTSLLSGLYFYSLRQGNSAIGRGKFVVVK